MSSLNAISENLEVFKTIIKNNRPHIKMKDISKQVLRKYKLGKDNKRHKILKNARKKAHTIKADVKRDISNNMKN